MTDSPKSRKDFSGAGDARVRSFLRQAAAIISSTRGLNDESQRKLRSLADHLGLTDEQYDQAIVHLKQSDHAAFQLNHWEKDFLAQLKKKFSKLPQNILKVSSEQRIISVAREKYQINETRARQLIDHYVEQMGIGRINKEDAVDHLRQSAQQVIGKKPSLSQSHRQNLYKVGQNWGLNQDEVDEIILQRLQTNRIAFQSSGSGWAWGVTALLLILALGGGGVLIWKPELLNWNRTIGNGNTNNGGGDLVSAASLPGWWSSETAEAVTFLVQQRQLPDKQFQRLQSEDILVRQSAYDWWIANLFDSEELERGLKQLLSEEPATEVVGAVVQQVLERLSPGSVDFPCSVKQVREAFATNRWIVDQLYRDSRASNEEDEFTRQLRTAIEDHWQLGMLPEDVDVYFRGTEPILARRFWSQLVDTSWAYPSRGAVLLKPLVELTQSVLPAELLNQYRFRTLMSILEADPGRWRELRTQIASAVDSADDVKIQKWIEQYQRSSNREWRNFLGSTLAAKLKLPAGQNIGESLSRAARDFRRRRFRDLIAKSGRVVEMARSALQNVNLKGDLDRPDLIAQLAFANNTLLQFEIEFGKQLGYRQTDAALAQGLPELRRLIGLEAEKNVRSGLTSTPSDADVRDLKRAIGRIADPEESVFSKRTAMDRLAQMANRMDDISYADAAILADYMLGQLDLESSLNVEKNLRSFQNWSNLGLAIADRIPQSQAGLDQVLTIAILQQGRTFASGGDDQWRSRLQSEMIASIENRIRRRLEKQSSPTELDWQRLEIYLPDLLRQRGKLVADQSQQSVANSAGAHLREALAAVLKDGNWPPMNVDRLVSVMRKETDSELQDHLTLLQLLWEGMIVNTENDYPDSAEVIRSLKTQYRQLTSAHESVGERILVVEYCLLRLLVVRHEQMVEERVDAS